MEKYLNKTADELEDVLAACTDFQERRSIRGALRELKGLKIEGDTAVTYSFGPNTIRKLSSLKSPRSKTSPRSQNSNKSSPRSQKSPRTNSRSQNSSKTSPRVQTGSQKHLQTKTGNSKENLCVTNPCMNENSAPGEDSRFRSYLRVGSLSKGKSDEPDKIRKIKIERANSVPNSVSGRANEINQSNSAKEVSPHSAVAKNDTVQDSIRKINVESESVSSVPNNSCNSERCEAKTSGKVQQELNFRMTNKASNDVTKSSNDKKIDRNVTNGAIAVDSAASVPNNTYISETGIQSIKIHETIQPEHSCHETNATCREVTQTVRNLNETNVPNSISQIEINADLNEKPPHLSLVDVKNDIIVTKTTKSPRKISYRTSPFAPSSQVSQLRPISATISRNRLVRESAGSETGSVVADSEQLNQSANSTPSKSKMVNESRLVHEISGENGSVFIERDKSPSSIVKDLHATLKMRTKSRRNFSESDVISNNREIESENALKRHSYGSNRDTKPNQNEGEKLTPRKMSTLTRRGRIESDPNSPRYLQKYQRKDKGKGILSPPARRNSGTDKPGKQEIKQGQTDNSSIYKRTSGSTDKPVKKESTRRKLPEIPKEDEIRKSENSETVHERMLRLLKERRKVRREQLKQEKPGAIGKNKPDPVAVDKPETEASKNDVTNTDEGTGKQSTEKRESKRKAYRVRRERQLMETRGKDDYTNVVVVDSPSGDKTISTEPERAKVRRPVRRSKSETTRRRPVDLEMTNNAGVTAITETDKVDGGTMPLTPDTKINLIGTLMQEEAKLQETLRKSTNFNERRKLRADIRQLREKRTALEGSGEAQSVSTLQRSASIAGGEVTPRTKMVAKILTDGSGGIEKTNIEELRKKLSETTDYDEKRNIRLALRHLRQQSRDGSLSRDGQTTKLVRSQSVIEKSPRPGNSESAETRPNILRSQSVLGQPGKTGDAAESHWASVNGIDAETIVQNGETKLDHLEHDIKRNGTDSKSNIAIHSSSKHSNPRHSASQLSNREYLHSKDIDTNTCNNRSHNSSDTSSCHVSNGYLDKHDKECESEPLVSTGKKRFSSGTESNTSYHTCSEHEYKTDSSRKLSLDDSKGYRSNKSKDYHLRKSESDSALHVGSSEATKSEVKIRPSKSHILVSRADSSNNSSKLTTNSFDDVKTELTDQQTWKSELLKSCLDTKHETGVENHSEPAISHNKAITERLSPNIPWLEEKKKSSPTPNELDPLMSTMDIEAAFSEILDAVDHFPSASSVSEAPTSQTAILEEETSESSSPTVGNKINSCQDDNNQCVPNDSKDKGVPNDSNNEAVLSDSKVSKVLDKVQSAKTEFTFPDVVKSDNKENTAIAENGQTNTDVKPSAIETADADNSNSVCRPPFNSSLSLSPAPLPGENNTVSIIHGDDGTVTVKEVKQTQEGDNKITEWKKLRRTNSRTEVLETDILVEKTVTSPGGLSEIQEKEISKTKRILTKRGSEYFQRNDYNVHRVLDSDGKETAHHALSSTSENMSVSKNKSWGDKSEATVTLTRDTIQKPPTGRRISFDTAQRSPSIDEDVESTDVQTEEKAVISPTGRPSGCPEITSPLKEVSSIEGSTTMLECSVSSSPLPSVTWYHGHKVIEEDDHFEPRFDRNSEKAELRICDIRVEHLGTYKVVFSNILGTAETKAKLNVKRKATGPPEFLSKLVDVSVSEGQALTLECEVAGASLASWLKDGLLQRHSADFKQSFDGTKAKLEIGEAFLDDYGTYTCLLKNSQGERKCSCAVRVTESISDDTIAPAFLKKLDTQIVDESDIVIFECDVIGSPQPTITWYLDRAPIELGPGYRMVYNGRVARLIIKQAGMGDNGKLECFAENSAGRVSTDCLLVVKEMKKVPTISTLLSDVSVETGRAAILQCCIMGEPSPSITWKKGARIIGQMADFKQTYDDNVAKLVIGKACVQDTGRYMCVASNPHGDATTSCKLVVKEIKKVPTVSTRLSDVSVETGRAAILQCCIMGEPSPSITWKKGARIIGQMADFKQTYDDNVAKLVIGKACVQDTGRYMCVASNPHGDATTSCKLVVKEAPKTKSQPETDKVKTIEDTKADVTPKKEFPKRFTPKVDNEQNHSEAPKTKSQPETDKVKTVEETKADITPKKEFPKRFTPKVDNEQNQASKSNASKVMLVRKASLENIKCDDNLPSDKSLSRTGSLKSFPKKKLDEAKTNLVSDQGKSDGKTNSDSNISHVTPDVVQHDPVNQLKKCLVDINRNDITLDSTTVNLNLVLDSTKMPKSEIHIVVDEPKDTMRIHKMEPQWVSKAPVKTDVTTAVKTDTAVPKFGVKTDITTAVKTDTSTPKTDTISSKEKALAVFNTLCSKTDSNKPPRFDSGVRRTQSVRAAGGGKPEWLQVKLRKVAANKSPLVDSERRTDTETDPSKEKNEIPTLPSSSVKNEIPSVSSTSSVSKVTEKEPPTSVHKDISLNKSQSARIFDKNAVPALNDSTNTLEATRNKDKIKLSSVSERAKMFQSSQNSTSPFKKEHMSETINKEMNLNRAFSMKAPLGERTFGIQRSQSFRTPIIQKEGVTLDLTPQYYKDEGKKSDSGPTPKIIKFWDPTETPTDIMDYSKITNEDELHKLLSNSDNFETRKKIRARIKELREIHEKEWKTKQEQREKETEDLVRKRYKDADVEKQRKLEAFKEQASHQTESRHLEVAEKHLKEKMKAADEEKQRRLEAFDRMARKEDVSSTSSVRTETKKDGRTVTTRKVETVQRTGGVGGTSYGKPAEQTAHHLTQQLINATGSGVSGVINVKTESWSSTDGVTNKSEKTESWGAKPANKFKEMDKKNAPAGGKTNFLGASGGGGGITRSPSAIKTMLLEWTKAMTREYIETIEITNFSTSWNDGLAFCALIHHFYPESFDFKKLDSKHRRANFELAFDTAEKYADIAPLLDVEDMVKMKKPDWKCVFTYVQSFYRHLRDHELNKTKTAED